MPSPGPRRGPMDRGSMTPRRGNLRARCRRAPAGPRARACGADLAHAPTTPRPPARAQHPEPTTAPARRVPATETQPQRACPQKRQAQKPPSPAWTASGQPRARADPSSSASSLVIPPMATDRVIGTSREPGSNIISTARHDVVDAPFLADPTLTHTMTPSNPHQVHADHHAPDGPRASHAAHRGPPSRDARDRPPPGSVPCRRPDTRGRRTWRS